MTAADRLLNPQTSEFEWATIEDGLWYRRGPPCGTCESVALQGVIFRPATGEELHDRDANTEICATCTSFIDVTPYGEKQVGRVRIYYPPDSDDLTANPYLNPLDRSQESPDYPTKFVDAGLHDIGNGRRLALAFGERIRYTPSWGWLVYDGRRWLRDDRGALERFAKATIQDMINALGKAVWAFETDRKKFEAHTFASSSRGKVEAMLSMAASEPEIATGIEQFDQYPWLLNCRNGIIDLTTGQLRPHDPELYLTQLLPHDYDPDAECPRWLQFLHEITCGDQELSDYIHRAVGYSFTGETSEEKLFFMYGGGANGKSKFIGALRHVLGDYGTSLSFEALLNSRNSTPEQGFAHLPGKRLATATEAGGNRSWNQEALTRITGRDAIRGKQLYKDTFEFYAVCKIWVAANNLPRVEDYGEAMWRRLSLIPFLAHFEGANKDPDLEAKLKDEAKGIFAWAVRGAARWYRERLRVEPAILRESLRHYREDSDTLGSWITEYCELGSTLKCTAKELYASYRAYAKENNEREMTQTAFGTALSKWRSGRLKRERRNTGVLWLGITTRELMGPGSLDIHNLDPPKFSPHDRLRIVLDLVRTQSASNPAGYAREEDLVVAAADQMPADDVRLALAELRRNNSVYAKGGTGTYTPLN